MSTVKFMREESKILLGMIERMEGRPQMIDEKDARIASLEAALAEARARNDELSRELERVRDDLASHEAWARIPCESGEAPCEKDVELVKLRGFLAGARADVHNLRREVCMEYVADDDAWNEVIDMKDPAVILDWFGSARNYAASRYGEEVADGLFDEDLRKWKEREKAPEANSEERQEEGRGDV